MGDANIFSSELFHQARVPNLPAENALETALPRALDVAPVAIKTPLFPFDRCP